MAKICPSCKTKKGKKLCNHEIIGIILIIIVALVLVAKSYNLF